MMWKSKEKRSKNHKKCEKSYGREMRGAGGRISEKGTRGDGEIKNGEGGERDERQGKLKDT